MAVFTINMKKSEYLIVGTQYYEDLCWEKGNIQEVSWCRYVVVILNKQGSNKKKIKKRAKEEKQAIKSPISIL